MNRPTVLVVSRRTTRKDRQIDYVGELHLELLLSLGVLPVIVPVVEGTMAALGQYMEHMGGLLLPEGDDVDPTRYNANEANFEFVESTHPTKDAIELRLLHEAQLHDVPVMGICRGSQILNVSAGGTLYGDVQKEKGSHRMHIHYDNYDAYRHPVTILPDTPLYGWYRTSDLQVNSYHHQGVRDLAPRFEPMAYADDGLVEAFYDPAARFTVGLQFHPERMLIESPGHMQVWKAFTGAILERAGK